MAELERAAKKRKLNEAFQAKVKQVNAPLTGSIPQFFTPESDFLVKVSIVMSGWYPSEQILFNRCQEKNCLFRFLSVSFRHFSSPEQIRPSS
jgi:hypothetical protein